MTGSDILPGSAYGITDYSHTAHLRQEMNQSMSLCNRSILGSVPIGDDRWVNSLGYADGYHCITCDTRYRVAHGGKCAVTFDF